MHDIVYIYAQAQNPRTSSLEGKRDRSGPGTGIAHQDASAVTNLVARSEADSLQTPLEKQLSWSLYNQGDQVFVKIPWILTGHSSWEGPFSVTKVLGSHTFLLSDGQVWSSRYIRSAPPAPPGHDEVRIELPDIHSRAASGHRPGTRTRGIRSPHTEASELLWTILTSNRIRKPTNLYGRS